VLWLAARQTTDADIPVPSDHCRTSNRATLPRECIRNRSLPEIPLIPTAAPFYNAKRHPVFAKSSGARVDDSSVIRLAHGRLPFRWVFDNDPSWPLGRRHPIILDGSGKGQLAASATSF